MSGIAIFGITGRMGQSLIRELQQVPAALRPSDAIGSAGRRPRVPGEALDDHAAAHAIATSEPGAAPARLRLSGAIASIGSPALGRDAALDGRATGVIVTADAAAGLAGAAVAVDFSLASGVADHARFCVEAGVSLLVGTTGFDGAARAALEAAAGVIPVLIAPNTSVGIAVMARLVKQAAAALGPGYDVEIAEAHHRLKRDAPSGTALALGQAVAAMRGTELSDIAVFDRQGTIAQREPGSVGFAVLRAGDIVGEHTVLFAGAGERVEITHRATDRATFARGALRAAAWLVGRPPGLYSMEDVLDLR